MSNMSTDQIQIKSETGGTEQNRNHLIRPGGDTLSGRVVVAAIEGFNSRYASAFSGEKKRSGWSFKITTGMKIFVPKMFLPPN